MSHNPIEKWSTVRFWTAFVILLVLVAAAITGITLNDRPLKKTCTKSSAALEYIASPAKAQNIVVDWQTAQVVYIVDRGVGIDFFFIVVYSTLLALTVFRCGNAIPLVEWWHTVGDRLGWWMWLAGGLDVLENLGILVELHLHRYGVAYVTASLAALKWGTIALGFLYIAFTVVLWLRSRAGGESSELRDELKHLRLDSGNGDRISPR